MNFVRNTRRYCLLQSFDARLREQFGLAAALKGKQQAEPGTPIDTTWPSYSALIRAGYVCREDLDGADVAELVQHARIGSVEAGAVISRLAQP